MTVVSTTTLCNRACVRADATLVVTPPTVSHPFFFQHRTVSSHDTDINSAGEEEAPCTNASHACAGSLLKRALNNPKSPAPGTPWVLEAHHGPSSRRTKSSGPLDRASKMSHTKGPVQSDMAEQLFSSVKKSSMQ